MDNTEDMGALIKNVFEIGSIYLILKSTAVLYQ